MPASRSGEFALEKVRLILIVEADLEPNAAVNLGNRQERSWADIAMIQPNADSVHGDAEGTSRLSFDLHNEWIERHIALLSIAREAGAYGALSWCRVSDRAAPMRVRYRTFVGGDEQF